MSSSLLAVAVPLGSLAGAEVERLRAGILNLQRDLAEAKAASRRTASGLEKAKAEVKWLSAGNRAMQRELADKTGEFDMAMAELYPLAAGSEAKYRGQTCLQGMQVLPKRRGDLCKRSAATRTEPCELLPCASWASGSLPALRHDRPPCASCRGFLRREAFDLLVGHTTVRPCSCCPVIPTEANARAPSRRRLLWATR